MESKPPQEEGKEEKAQGTGSDPVLLTIEECKRHLELAKKAFLVGFLTFERDWNPYGYNDSHIYEDVRDVVVDSKLNVYKEAKRQLIKLI